MMSLVITITENVTDASLSLNTTTVTLAQYGLQGPPGTGGTAAYATNAGTSVFATNAGTSVFSTNAGTSIFATNAGTAVYATTSGTAVNISGTILASQVVGTAADLADNIFTGKQTLAPSTTASASLNLANGTAPTSPVTGDLWALSGSLQYQSSLGSQTLAYLSSNITGNAATAGTATYATTSGTSVFSTNAGTSVFSTNAGTSVFATNAGTSVFATNAGTAVYATTSGTAVNISGTITATQVTGTAAVLTSANTFTTGEQVIKTGADATRGLAVWRNSVSQSADILVILSSTGATTLAAFGPTGALTVTPSSGTAATINAASSAVGLQVKANATTPGNLQEWQASAGTVLGGRNAAGQTFAGSTASQVGSTTTALTSAQYTSATVAVFTYGGTSLVQVGQTVTVAGVTGGAYNGTWVVTAVTSTTFTVLGSGFTNNAGTGGTFKLSAVGSFTAGTAAITPLIARAAASQSANIQEWQDSTGATLAKVDGSGNIFGNSVRTNSSYFRADETFSGASIQLKKLTSSALVPGASDYAKLYFRDGTNTGTLKLVVRAGTAGAETTILDNIPQT